MTWQTVLISRLQQRDAEEKAPCVALVAHHRLLRASAVQLRAQCDQTSADRDQAVRAAEVRVADADAALAAAAKSSAEAIEELSGKLSAAEEKAAKLEKMASDNDQLRASNDTLSDAVTALEAEATALQRELMNRSHTQMLLQEEYKALSNENQMQRTNFASVREENARMMPLLLAAKETEAELRNDIFALESKLSRAPAAERARLAEPPSIFGREKPLVECEVDSSAPGCAHPVPSGIAHSTNASSADLHTVAIDGSSKRIWAGGVEKSVRSWDAASGQQLSLLSSPGSVVCLDSKGSFLAGGCVNFTVILWHLPTNRLHSQFTGHTEVVTAVCMTASTQHIFSVSRDSTVKCWDIARGVKSYSSLCASSCNDLAVNTNNVCTAHYDNTLRLWDVRTGKRTGEIVVHSKAVTSVRLSSCDTYAVSLSRDNTVRKTDLRMLKEVALFDDPAFIINSNLVRIALSPDAGHVAAGSASGAIFIWDIRNKEAKPKVLSKGHTKAIMSVAWAPDGSGVASVGLDKRLVFWR